MTSELEIEDSKERSPDYQHGSVHRRPAAAFLVLLPGAARARVVPPDLGSVAPWFARAGTRTDLPMRPKIPIRPQESRRHMHDDFFALLWAARPRPRLMFLWP